MRCQQSECNYQSRHTCLSIIHCSCHCSPIATPPNRIDRARERSVPRRHESRRHSEARSVPPVGGPGGSAGSCVRKTCPSQRRSRRFLHPADGSCHRYQITDAPVHSHLVTPGNERCKHKLPRSAPQCLAREGRGGGRAAPEGEPPVINSRTLLTADSILNVSDPGCGTGAPMADRMPANIHPEHLVDVQFSKNKTLTNQGGRPDLPFRHTTSIDKHRCTPLGSTILLLLLR